MIVEGFVGGENYFFLVFCFLVGCLCFNEWFSIMCMRVVLIGYLGDEENEDRKGCGVWLELRLVILNYKIFKGCVNILL